MKIEIWSDFACPFCYIGKKRFELALNKFEHKDKVEVVYKAYQLNPFAPKKMEGNAYESFAKNHDMSIEETKQRFAAISQHAKSVGLEFNFDILQMTNTFDAHRLAKWANTFGKEIEITERLMKAYFLEGKNLAEIETLVDIVEELGFNYSEARDILNSRQYEEEVRNQIKESRSIGIQGVPFFVLNRRYGISGAQGEETFAQALEQLWIEENPLQTIGGDGAVCTDGNCEIN